MTNFEYPYTDFHEINLDWVIAQIRKLAKDMSDFKVLNQITFAGTWDITKSYKIWSFVDDGNGMGYLSIKPVPAGILLDNEDYWRLVANYSVIFADFQNRLIALEHVDEVKLIHFVTPEQYGAVGDGSADDTEALQACIENGNYIKMTGTYRITSTINFDDKHDIVMDGGSIVRDHDLTFNTIHGRRVNNVVIKNVTFDGNGNVRTTVYTWRDNIQACIILADQSNNIVVENCEVLNFNYGIYLNGVDVEDGSPSTYENISFNGQIKNCRFHNCNSGVDTYGKNILVQNNTFMDNTGVAIAIEPNDNVGASGDPLNDANFYTSAVGAVVSGNLIINTGVGINIHGNNYGASVVNNTIIDFDYAIYCTQGVRNCIIDGNQCIHQNDIEVDADTRPWNTKYAAVYIGSGVVLSNNYLDECYTAVLVVSSDVRIHDNVINKAVISAFSFNQAAAATDVATVVNNTIVNFEKAAGSWWACRPIVFAYHVKAYMCNNYVTCDTQPIYALPGGAAEAHIEKLYADQAQSDSLPSDLSTYYVIETQ